MNRPGASSSANDAAPEAAPMPRGTAKSAAPIDLDKLRATSARRRTARASSDLPADWADPDPAAALALPSSRHPVAQTVARRSTLAGQRDEAAALRRICARLLVLPDEAVTDEKALVFPWHQITPDEAEEFRRDVYRRYSNQATRNDYVCVMRAVVKRCYLAGLMSPHRRDLLIERLYTSAPGRSTKRRRLSRDDVTALLNACETLGNEKARHRNTAIVALMRTTGIRSCEVVRLDVADWDRDEHTMLLRETKNGRPHTVFVHPSTNIYLNRWLATRGSEPGALFSSVNGTSHHHLHTFAIRYMLTTRGEAAGVRSFGSHDFRRTFATELLRTHDHALVSRLLNHESLSSTLVYDLAEDDLQRAAVDTVRLFADPEEDQDGSTGVLV